MKEIFNDLLECIIILDNCKRVVFINNEFKNQIGYKESHLPEQKLNEIIIVKEDSISILCKDKSIIEATAKFRTIILEENSYYISIVKWEENRVNILENIERCINSIEQYISIRNNDSKYIFINDKFTEGINGTKEEIKRSMNLGKEYSDYNEIIRKRDDYVRGVKASCCHEEFISSTGTLEYYDVKNYPIFDNSGSVEYIVDVLEDTTFRRGVQTHMLYVINILEKIYNCGSDINEYEVAIFDCLEPIFKKYFQSEYFNIWAYDKERQCIKAYFNNNMVESSQEIKIERRQIEKYLSNDYKRILYTGENNKDKGYSPYIVRYAITYCNEFLGLLTINYDEFPNCKIIENDLINNVCIQLGYMMKYVQISQLVNEIIR